MQKSRRWRGLELDLLSMSLLVACTPPPPPAAAPIANPAETRAAAPPAASALASSAPATSAPAAPASQQPEPVAGAMPVAAPPPLPAGTLVLQIGDSFADALGGQLGKLLRAVGVRSDLEFETPSYIPNWSYGAKLPRLVSNDQPDLILITLGANEIEIPHPEERAKPIRHLVKMLGGRPCVWVAPPLWKPDSGVLKVIRDNVAPCRYLDSNLLLHDLPRARDKIHPSPEGREIWAKAVFNWLSRERVGSAEHPWELKPDAGVAAAE